VRRLGTAGVRPAWSRDGSQIAYVAVPSRTQVVPDWRTWIVPAGGGVSREIPGRDGVLAEPIEWSPDGKQLLITTADGIDLVDAASGRVVRHLDELAGAFGHWRDATPQIVLPTFATRGAPVASRLVSLDTGAGAERVLVESKETFDAGGIPSASISFSDPRWSPVADQILYVAVRQNPTGPSAFATHVYDVASGKDAVISPSAYQATWTWDGGQIVYLTPSAAFRGYGASLRIAGRDGSGDRELLGESDNTFFFSVASLSY